MILLTILVKTTLENLFHVEIIKLSKIKILFKHFLLVDGYRKNTHI